MRITILGSGTGVPSAERGPAGYALAGAGAPPSPGQRQRHTGESSCGWGWTTGRSTPRSSPTATPTTPWTSASLIHALNFTPGYVRTAPLRAIGPPGFIHFADRLLAAYPSLADRGYPLDLAEVDDGAAVDARVGERRPWPESPTVSIRGRTPTASPAPDGVAVFSGDCSPSPALADLARRADLLVAEASFVLHHGGLQRSAHDRRRGRAHGPGGRGRDVGADRTSTRGPLEGDIRAACAREFQGRLILARDDMRLEVAGGRVTISN